MEIPVFFKRIFQFYCYYLTEHPHLVALHNQPGLRAGVHPRELRAEHHRGRGRRGDLGGDAGGFPGVAGAGGMGLVGERTQESPKKPRFFWGVFQIYLLAGFWCLFFSGMLLWCESRVALVFVLDSFVFRK